MEKITLKGNNIPFEALLFRAENANRKILFAVGSGGNPERHLPLLKTLSNNNCTVIAPYFDRIVSPIPTEEELLSRAGCLLVALDFLDDVNVPIIGIGHSIGATLLVALSGGQMWIGPDKRLPIRADERLKKLVLVTPPTGFFQAPKALANVQASMQIWGGTLDTITPPEQITTFKKTLADVAFTDIHLIEGAGHFSFMNTLPPNVIDPMKNREEFLSKFANEVSSFITK